MKTCQTSPFEMQGAPRRLALGLGRSIGEPRKGLQPTSKFDHNHHKRAPTWKYAHGCERRAGSGQIFSMMIVRTRTHTKQKESSISSQPSRAVPASGSLIAGLMRDDRVGRSRYSLFSPDTFASHPLRAFRAGLSTKCSSKTQEDTSCQAWNSRWLRPCAGQEQHLQVRSSEPPT